MTLILSFLGIFLFLLCKTTILSPDRGVALWRRLLELPVDANLVGFMLTVATISQLAAPTEHAPAVVLASMILMIISIILWKSSSKMIIDNGVTTEFSRPCLLMALTVVNVALALGAIALPILSLGAKI
jgi:hypothetical protein